MALATSTLRNLWAPACGRKGRIYTAAYRALDTVMHRHSYRPRAGVTGAYNCRKITGGTGYSLHAYGVGDIFTFWTGVRCATSLAVDINWDANPYGPRLVTDMPRAMVDDIEAIRTNSGAQVWRWGGYYRGNKDAMHFEIVCSPADLATGIDPATVRSATPDPPEEFDMTPEEREQLLDDIAERVQLKMLVEDTRWIDWRIAGQSIDLRASIYAARDTVAALVRRITGTKAVKDGPAQHELDAATGTAVQAAIASKD